MSDYFTLDLPGLLPTEDECKKVVELIEKDYPYSNLLEIEIVSELIFFERHIFKLRLYFKDGFFLDNGRTTAYAHFNGLARGIILGMRTQK